MASHRTLTELALSAAKPPEKGALTIWDGALKHFGVRISQGGAKSFIVLLGSGRRQTIGRYPTLSIAAARAKARQLLAERALGKYTPKSIQWSRAVEEFLAHAGQTTRPRTASEYARTLKHYFAFGTTRLADITKADVAKKLTAIKDAPSQREHARVAAKIFFNWAMKQGYVDSNPCAAAATKSTTRARVLTDAELKSLWEVCGNYEKRSDGSVLNEGSGDLDSARPSLPGVFKTIVQLLILTGQRRGEIAALQAKYFSHEQQTLSLPDTLTKNRREHTFPVSATATRILKATIEAQSAPLLFPARGQTTKPFNGWSKSKTVLDQLSGVTNWTLHDIRRTFATRLAELGVAPHIIERLLNHVSGTISGVSAIYNRAQYLPEMRAAVDLYENRLRDKIIRE